MVRDIIDANGAVLPNDKQMGVLRENFPSCFRKDGSFDIERFKEYLGDKITINNEGYELKFLGKIIPVYWPPWIRLPLSFQTKSIIASRKIETARISIFPVITSMGLNIF